MVAIPKTVAIPIPVELFPSIIYCCDKKTAKELLIIICCFDKNLFNQIIRIFYCDLLIKYPLISKINFAYKNLDHYKNKRNYMWFISNFYKEITETYEMTLKRHADIVTLYSFCYHLILNFIEKLNNPKDKKIFKNLVYHIIRIYTMCDYANLKNCKTIEIFNLIF